MSTNNVNKVAAITFFFWVMKICATTLGETAGDLLSMTMNVGYAVSTMLLMSVFVVVLVAQLRVKKFHPVLFWTVILATSTAGTTMSDFMDRTLGLGYAKGSLILVVLLLSTLALWFATEKTLSISSITTTRSELFFWIAILFSNTLGTALGDFLADDSGLGFMGGAALIGSVIAVIALASQFTRLNRTMLFWIAFVLTRPFGATFGDFMTKPLEQGGLNWGTIRASMVLSVLLVGTVIFTSIKDHKTAAVNSAAMDAEQEG